MNVAGCLYQKSNSAIMVMKPAEDEHRYDAAYVLDCAMDWSVFVERPMKSSTRCSRRHTSSEPFVVRFAQDNHMVDALASDQTAQPFGEAVLPT